jgi:hypothetical protein
LAQIARKKLLRSQELAVPSQLKLGLESFFRSVITQRKTQLTADVLHHIVFAARNAVH